MGDPIIIRHVEPAGKGDNLKGCYYLPHEDDGSHPKKDRTFDFYDKDGQLKATGVKIGSTIKFHLDDMPDTEWSLTTTLIDDRRVLGDWSTAPKTGVGEPEGTYQGQAGGGSDAESTVSASGY